MVEKRSLGQKLDWAVYITFFVVVLCLPLLTDDVFWLNRISKFLVFGLLGLAIALSSVSYTHLTLPTIQPV